jgi:uncharacterized protein
MSTDQSRTETTRQVVQTLINAAKSGDDELLLSCYDDDIVVYEPSFLPYGGVYQGIEEFKGLWVQLVKYTDPSTIDMGPMIVDGERAVCQWTVKTRDPESECNMCEIYEVRNGKITEIRIFFNEAGSLISANK